jgi:hypothetical protein
MPKVTFVLKKDEVPGEWRKVHNEKQWDFRDSPNKLIMHRGLRWLKLKVRHHFEELVVAGRIISKKDLKGNG